MKSEDVKKIADEFKRLNEEREKQRKFISSIGLGLAIIISFSVCYGWLQPNSLGTFIAYILLSIVMSFGFLIPISFILQI